MSGLPTNGNGKNGWRTRTGIKGMQMLIADFVGNATELVFLKYQDKIDKALPFLKEGFKAAMYTPFKILQSPIEWVIDKMGRSIEGETGRDERHKQTSEQRLDGLLETGYHYASAIAVGWSSLVLAEKGLSRVMRGPNMPKELPTRMWWLVDLPVHLGATAFFGASFMKPVTGSMKDFTKKLMIASGWTEEKAEQDARFTVAYIIPNYLTLIPTVGMMSSLYKAESKGILHDVGKPGKSLLGFHSDTHQFQLTGSPAVPGEMGTIPGGLLKAAQWLGIVSGGPAASVPHA